MKKSTIVKVGIALIAGITGVIGIAQAQSTSLFTSQLQVGMRGSNVSKLQALLATDPLVYPEGIVSGYFGPLNQKRGAQFQVGYGIDPVGRMGPITLGRLNGLLMSGFFTVDVQYPMITTANVALANNAATISWTTNEQTRGKVYYDNKAIFMNEAAMAMSAPYVSGILVDDLALNVNHSVTLNNLTSGQTYTYVIVTTDAQGNVSVSTPRSFVMP